MKINKLSKEISAMLEKDSIVEFLATARQFIKLMEDDKLSQELFYKEAHKSLADLYQTALRLENVELNYSGLESEFAIDKDELRKHNKERISNLGKDSFYWEVFDPTYTEEDGKPGHGWKITDKDASQGWLVDDFTDIYTDLKKEIFKIDEIGTDESIEDALWQLKYGFYAHWGNHCINAIRALHYLWYDGKI